MKRSQLKDSACPLSSAMACLGSKWKPIIIVVLSERTLRFGQLAAIINIISRKVLSEQLRELEEDDIVARQSFKEIPPRVEYHLTDRGIELLPIFKKLEDWENKYAK